MKKTLMRRSVAAVASLGLVVVGIPLATTPAAAQVEACALGATCEGETVGSKGAAPYIIQMPEKFNGTVMMYSHGYRFADPIPAAFAGQLGVSTSPFYDPTTVPGLSQAIPPLRVDTAFRANNKPMVAPNATVAANLLAQGYALVGSGRAQQGWAVEAGVESGENLLRLVNAGGIRGVKRVVTWGDSQGGYISVALAERNPRRIAGVLPMCGALVDPVQLFSGAMTALFTWKTLATPNLRIANYAAGPTGYFQAMGDLATVFGALAAFGDGSLSPGSASPVGVPYLNANLLGGLMAGLPTKSSVYDGQTVNPIVEQLAQDPAIGQGRAASVASAQGFSPVLAGQSTALGMLENVGSAAALGILGRLDLERQARTALSLAPTDNVNFNDNVPVRYSLLLSSEQRGEFGDTLNANALGQTNVLQNMFDRLDASVGNPTVRYPANPAVVNWVRNIVPLTGKYNQPTVLITTTYDPATPDGNQGSFTNRLERSWKQQGRKAGLNRIVSLYTIPPADGYTQFSPGARTANTPASIAANLSGVGHCQFSRLDNSVQIINSVSVLNRLMNAKTQKQVAAARRLGFNTPGVNNDRLYVPEPLKRPLATAAR
jgi:hypothetical protein